MARSYNSFSPEFRDAAGREQGRLLRRHPEHRQTACRACTADYQVVQHLEDYREPLRGIVGLCFRCHVIVHERFEHQDTWTRYVTAITQGAAFEPATNWLVVLKDTVRSTAAFDRSVAGPARGATFLDVIGENRWLELGAPGSPPSDLYLAEWALPTALALPSRGEQ